MFPPNEPFQIVTQGIQCGTAGCAYHLHNHCFQVILKAQKERASCPACKGDWSSKQSQKNMVDIGPKAFKEGQDSSRRHRELEQDEEPSEEGEEEPAEKNKGKEKRRIVKRYLNKFSGEAKSEISKQRRGVYSS
jgi:hypothetical protein